MIKLISCFHKRSDISIQEFRKLWDSPEFTELIRNMAHCSRAKSFAKNATLQIDMNQVLAEMRNSQSPFEGTIEYWWDKASDFQGVVPSKDFAEAGRKLLIFQRGFIDMSNSHSFFTESSVEEV